MTVSGTKALAKPGDPLVYPWNHLAEVLIIENIPSVSSGCFVNFTVLLQLFSREQI